MNPILGNVIDHMRSELGGVTHEDVVRHWSGERLDGRVLSYLKHAGMDASRWYKRRALLQALRCVAFRVLVSNPDNKMPQVIDKVSEAFSSVAQADTTAFGAYLAGAKTEYAQWVAKEEEGLPEVLTYIGLALLVLEGRVK